MRALLSLMMEMKKQHCRLNLYCAEVSRSNSSVVQDVALTILLPHQLAPAVNSHA